MDRFAQHQLFVTVFESRKVGGYSKIATLKITVDGCVELLKSIRETFIVPAGIRRILAGIICEQGGIFQQ